ncbi:MAG: hypothetical protein WC054_00735 [Candidatus Nanopelagicales bacterium]
MREIDRLRIKHREFVDAVLARYDSSMNKDLIRAFETAERLLGWRTPLGHLADVLIGCASDDKLSVEADNELRRVWQPLERKHGKRRERLEADVLRAADDMAAVATSMGSNSSDPAALMKLGRELRSSVDALAARCRGWAELLDPDLDRSAVDFDRDVLELIRAELLEEADVIDMLLWPDSEYARTRRAREGRKVDPLAGMVIVEGVPGEVSGLAPEFFGEGARPCDCSRCVESVRLSSAFGVHRFELPGEEGSDVWRWVCGCGSVGRWQSQSGAVAYHAWRRHAGLGK